MSHRSNEGEQWTGLLAAAAIGLFFCLTLRRTGSLWFAVGFHAAWDWGETFVYSVPDSGTVFPGHLLKSSFHGPGWLTGGMVGPEGSLLCFMVIAVVWGVFARAYREVKYAGERIFTTEGTRGITDSREGKFSMSMKSLFIMIALLSACGAVVFGQTEIRPRVRDLGVQVGVLPPGPLNAITDVAGVKVGQTTLIRGDNIRTGVTAILPHGGNLYKERVPGAVFLGNAYGKLAGSTQVNEMGEIETPILLTATDSVPRVADAVDHLHVQPQRKRKCTVGESAGGGDE